MTAYEAGQYALCGDYYQYTPSGAAAFRTAGRWTQTPERGHIAFFYSTSLKRIAHTGIVIKADYNASDSTWNIWTIEGNTSSVTTDRNGGEVRQKAYMHISIGGRNWFCGFGVPRYGDDTCSADGLIKIATAEIGYEEKASASNLYDKKANPGRNNYTKYSRFDPDFSTPAQWCGQFVSWCVYRACATAQRYVPGWIVQDDGAWTYRKPDGSFCADEWLYNGGRWYVFSGDGRMITGWYDDGVNWYYMADDGGMCASQWVLYGDAWYYLTASGAMATDACVLCDPMGYCYVDDAGVWNGKYTGAAIPGKDIAI